MTQADTETSQVPIAGLPDNSHQSPLQPRVRARTVVAAFAAIVAFFVVVGLVLYLQPGRQGEPSGEPALDVFAAGPAEIYELGSITYFEHESFYLVRLTDGSFVALYDLSPLAQGHVAAGSADRLDCRLQVRGDEQMAGWLRQSTEPPPLLDRGFFDACEGTAWDAEGYHIGGKPAGSLDRFPVGTVEGIVRVDLGNRQCLNEIEPGSPCISTR